MLRDLDDMDLELYESVGGVPEEYEANGNNDKWVYLPFLNGEVGKYQVLDEQDRKDKIKAALDKRFTEYKDNLRRAGILKTHKQRSDDDEGSITRLVYLDDYVGPLTYEAVGKLSESKMDEFLRLHFYNHVFHMVQQMQLTTVDPAFYKGTTDL